MKITAVSMRVVDREKVKAFASITVDEEFVVHDLRIIDGQKGFFVAMPSRKLPNGEFRDVAHPIKPEVREMIQTAVLDEYEQKKKEMTEAPEPAATTTAPKEKPEEPKEKLEEPKEAKEEEKTEQTKEEPVAKESSSTEEATTDAAEEPKAEEAPAGVGEASKETEESQQ